MKIKLPPSGKPRNPFAVAARQRVAGAHDKSGKAKRQAQRQALQRAWRTDRFD
ncbi:hypothetical protein GCM10007860_02470 [Chitiniphilus shinanonensis]|uniref:Uncharacterized protein n=1 Tax=Chitiniphilus shinanonensis TaxID=553088 RepID=A0ABQ6BN72_9NEIS|nr:hypothetical protein [Chitiniphilus shinanonensis]GLS03104.1 hypothetical protein GCM10007860_02470 [Chitiniphilus shinanonensis]